MKKYLLMLLFLSFFPSQVKAQTPWDLIYHAIPLSPSFDIPEEIAQIAAQIQTATAQSKKIVMTAKTDASSLKSAVTSTFNKVTSSAIISGDGNPGQSAMTLCGTELKDMQTEDIAKKVKEVLMVAKSNKGEYKVEQAKKREKFYMDNLFAIFAASQILQQDLDKNGDIRAKIDKAKSCAEGKGGECGIPATDEGGNNETIFTYGKTLEAMESVVRLWESVAALKARLEAVKMIYNNIEPELDPNAIADNNNEDEQAFLRIPQAIIKYRSSTPLVFAQTTLGSASTSLNTNKENSKQVELSAKSKQENEVTKDTLRKSETIVGDNELEQKNIELSSSRATQANGKATVSKDVSQTTSGLQSASKDTNIATSRQAELSTQKPTLSSGKATVSKDVSQATSGLQSASKDTNIATSRQAELSTQKPTLSSGKATVSKDVSQAQQGVRGGAQNEDRTTMDKVEEAAQEERETRQYVVSNIDFVAPDMSETENVLATLQEEMDANNEMTEVESLVANAIDTHNFIKELPTHKNMAEEYIKVKQKHEEAVRRLQTSEECSINYLKGYFKNPHYVWSGNLPLDKAKHHELRKGISGWALNAFELLKSGETSNVIDAFEIAKEQETIPEEEESDEYLTDQDALNEKVEKTMGSSNTKPDDIAQENLSDEEVSKKADDPCEYLDQNKEECAGRSQKYTETSGDKAVNNSISDDKKNSAGSEARESALFTWQIGAEASKLLPQIMVEWDNVQPTGKKMIWNDTKKFYRTYLNKKYNNVLRYMESFSRADLLKIIASKMRGETQGISGSDYQEERKKKLEELGGSSMAQLQARASKIAKNREAYTANMGVIEEEKKVIEAEINRLNEELRTLKAEVNATRAAASERAMQSMMDKLTAPVSFPIKNRQVQVSKEVTPDLSSLSTFVTSVEMEASKDNQEILQKEKGLTSAASQNKNANKAVESVLTTQRGDSPQKDLSSKTKSLTQSQVSTVSKSKSREIYSAGKDSVEDNKEIKADINSLNKELRAAKTEPNTLRAVISGRAVTSESPVTSGRAVISESPVTSRKDVTSERSTQPMRTKFITPIDYTKESEIPQVSEIPTMNLNSLSADGEFKASKSNQEIEQKEKSLKETEEKPDALVAVPNKNKERAEKTGLAAQSKSRLQKDTDHKAKSFEQLQSDTVNKSENKETDITMISTVEEEEEEKEIRADINRLNEEFSAAKTEINASRAVLSEKATPSMNDKLVTSSDYTKESEEKQIDKNAIQNKNKERAEETGLAAQSKSRLQKDTDHKAESFDQLQVGTVSKSKNEETYISSMPAVEDKKEVEAEINRSNEGFRAGKAETNTLRAVTSERAVTSDKATQPMRTKFTASSDYTKEIEEPQAGRVSTLSSGKSSVDSEFKASKSNQEILQKEKGLTSSVATQNKNANKAVESVLTTQRGDSTQKDLSSKTKSLTQSQISTVSKSKNKETNIVSESSIEREETEIESKLNSLNKALSAVKAEINTTRVVSEKDLQLSTPLNSSGITEQQLASKVTTLDRSNLMTEVTSGEAEANKNNQEIAQKEKRIEEIEERLNTLVAEQNKKKEKIEEIRLEGQSGSVSPEELDGSTQSVEDLLLANLTGEGGIMAMLAEQAGASAINEIKTILVESNNENPIEGFNVDKAIESILQNVDDTVELAKATARNIIITNGLKKMENLGTELYLGTSYHKLQKIHDDMINELKAAEFALDIGASMSPLLNIGNMAVFAEFLAGADTSPEEEGFFVGITPKERDMRAPYSLGNENFDLPPVREVVHFDAADFTNLKAVSFEGDDDYDSDGPKKKSKAKRIVEKEALLNLGIFIPPIWETILSDYPFIESRLPLTEIIKDADSDDEDDDKCEVATFVRGGIMPCLYGNNMQYFLDVNTKGNYEYGDKESKHNGLQRCAAIVVRDGKKPYHPFWQTNLAENLSGGKELPTIDECQGYSELGLLFEADRHNNLYLKERVFKNFKLVNKKGEKAIEKMAKKTRKNLSAARHSELSRNQIGDFLKQVEAEKAAQESLDEVTNSYNGSKEIMNGMFSEYGFTPSESFTLANKEDYKTAEKVLKEVKKLRLQKALEALNKIKVTDNNKPAKEKSKNMNKLIEFMGKDNDCVLKISMADADSKDLMVRLAKEIVNEKIIGLFKQTTEKEDDGKTEVEEAYCAVYWR